MNVIQLELEKQLSEYKALQAISIKESVGDGDDWTRGYACGQGAAYDTSIELGERLMEAITGVYPESEASDIPE